MKYILTDIYRLIGLLTKNKTLSVAIAVLYICLLTFFIFNGLALLLDASGFVLSLFTFPLAIIVIIPLYILFLWLMPTANTIAKNKKRPIGFVPIILFTLIALVSYLYVHFESQIKF